MTDERDWLWSSEAARHLGYKSAECLVRAARNGTIPGYQGPDRKWRFWPEELDEAIKVKRERPAPPVLIPAPRMRRRPARRTARTAEEL